MKKSRYSESQIIKVLKEVKGGRSAANTGLPKARIIPGKASMAGWKWPI